MLKINIFFFFIICSFDLLSQNIENFISEAISNSYEIQLAKAELKIADFEFRNFQISLRPTLSVSGNVPVYNKDNFAITQPDGTIRFLRRSQNYSNVGFSISQPLPFTGGSISLNTDLYRYDDFVSKTKRYNGTPVFLQVQQPLFAYNSYKWDKIIEPLKLKEARQKLSLQINQLTYDVCKAYFDILDAQTNKDLAKKNQETISVNLDQEKRKMQIGTSTEDKVLQLEIQKLNSQREYEAAELVLQSAFNNMYLIINKQDTLCYQINIPEILPPLQLNKDQLFEETQKQLPIYLSFQRKLLEAKSNTALIKSKNNSINVTASYGLTNSALTIPSIYQNTNDQQRFSIGFSLPIISWGKKKNNISVARLQEKIIDINNKLDEAKLKAEINTLINELPLLKKTVLSNLRIDTLTEKRYIITNRLFQTGKASLLEIQASQSEKDYARRNYIQALRRFWESWYLLKLKTNSK